jgi:hypothetical protein
MPRTVSSCQTRKKLLWREHVCLTRTSRLHARIAKSLRLNVGSVQLACFGIVRRRRNRLYLRSLAKPPPLIQRDAQRAARSRACLFVRGEAALNKRASAYKALIRMSSVVLTWIAGKPPMRAHPIPPVDASKIYVIRQRISCRGGLWCRRSRRGAFEGTREC